MPPAAIFQNWLGLLVTNASFTIFDSLLPLFRLHSRLRTRAIMVESPAQFEGFGLVVHGGSPRFLMRKRKDSSREKPRRQLRFRAHLTQENPPCHLLPGQRIRRTFGRRRPRRVRLGAHREREGAALQDVVVADE